MTPEQEERVWKRLSDLEERVKVLGAAITQLQDKHNELQKMCALSVRTLTEVAERLLKTGQW